MKIDDSIAQLEYFEVQKKHNNVLFSEIKGLFDSVLAFHDYSRLHHIDRILEDKDLILTGEINRMMICVKIHDRETKFRRNGFFMDDVRSYEELCEKYLRTELMLRRVELYPDETFADAAYEYICRNNISPCAVICITGSDKYEDKKNIVFNLWARIRERVDTVTRMEWLTAIGISYPDDNIYLETASLYLDYGQYENALNILGKISSPSEDVLLLKTELGDLING